MLSTLVDVVRIAVLRATRCVLTWQMMQKMGNYRMTIIDLPMNLVYGVCMFGFACASLRSIQVLRQALAAGLQRARAARDAIEESV